MTFDSNHVYAGRPQCQSRLIAPCLAAALMLTVASPALARDSATTTIATAATALDPGKFVWEDAPVLGPVSILISIADQRAYVYRGDRVVAVSSVSTGKDGNETPVGIFAILQKEEIHHSSLYDDAPMPYMQRLIWDGIAIHAGRDPGFPASHGCIRVPRAFAQKLFAATEMGAVVQVVDEPVFESTPAPRSEADIAADANRAAYGTPAGFLSER